MSLMPQRYLLQRVCVLSDNEKQPGCEHGCPQWTHSSIVCFQLVGSMVKYTMCPLELMMTAARDMLSSNQLP